MLELEVASLEASCPVTEMVSTTGLPVPVRSVIAGLLIFALNATNGRFNTC